MASIVIGELLEQRGSTEVCRCSVGIKAFDHVNDSFRRISALRNVHFFLSVFLFSPRFE